MSDKVRKIVCDIISEMLDNPDKLPKCINGSEFKQSQPIRLYTVEVKDET